LAPFGFVPGNGCHEEIFRDDSDRERFLFSLTEACGKIEMAGPGLSKDLERWKTEALRSEFKPVARGGRLYSE
jgi:hypothetical protein